MKPQPLQVADIPPADPRVSSEYINAKYRAWLQRRGLTDPAFAAELAAMEKRTIINFRKGSRGSKKK
jgi:hypothetical protein